MTSLRTHHVYARTVLVAVFALAFGAKTRAAEVNFLYAQTTSAQCSTNCFPNVPIDGLSFTLPAATRTFNAAVVTLNMPNLTLSAGGLADVSVLSQINGAGFASAAINNTYTPLTIVVKVSLKRTTQPIAAEWVTSNGATMSTQFSSISAILVKDDSQTDQ
jgi:hypothetical protein